MNSVLKKSVLAGFALLFAGSAIAETTLNFWSWRQEDTSQYEQIIEQFQKKHPEIKVKYTAHQASQYNTILTTALSGGEGPDIIHTRSYAGLEALANPGYLLPLDDKVDLSLFDKEARQGTSLRSDGKVYSVPFASQTMVVFYNTEIFRKLNLELPETFKEFKDVAQKLKDAGVIPIANGIADGWTVDLMSAAILPAFYGDEFFSDLTTGKTTFEDERFVYALEKFAELKPYLAPGYQAIDYATMKQLFMAGQAGMMIGGSFEIADFVKAEIPFDLFASPAAEAGSPRYAGRWIDGGYGVNANSPNKEAALEFIKFTATQEFGQLLTDKLANVSPIKGVKVNDPMLAKVAKTHETLTPHMMTSWLMFDAETGGSVIQVGLQDLFAGRKTAQEVAETIQASSISG